MSEYKTVAKYGRKQCTRQEKPSYQGHHYKGIYGNSWVWIPFRPEFFFSGFHFSTAYSKSCVHTCHDQSYLHIILRSSNISIFIYSLVFFTFYGYITNSRRGQLPFGLIAQLVEHCTGIALCWTHAMAEIIKRTVINPYYTRLYHATVVDKLVITL